MSFGESKESRLQGARPAAAFQTLLIRRIREGYTDWFFCSVCFGRPGDRMTWGARSPAPGCLLCSLPLQAAAWSLLTCGHPWKEHSTWCVISTSGPKLVYSTWLGVIIQQIQPSFLFRSQCRAACACHGLMVHHLIWMKK